MKAAAVLIALAAVAVPARAELIPISSQVSLRALASASANPITVTDQMSQTTTLDPLTATVNALSTRGDSFVNTFGSINAIWFSPSQVQVRYSELGWNLLLSSPPSQSDVDLRQFPVPDWSYTFQAMAGGTFTLDFDINVQVMQGSLGFPPSVISFFAVTRVDNQQPTFNLNLTGSGAITLPVTAGSTYTVGFGSGLNEAISEFGGTHDQTLILSVTLGGTFQESSPTPVPEPASLTLLGLGVLGLLGQLRRGILDAARAGR